MVSQTSALDGINQINQTKNCTPNTIFMMIFVYGMTQADSTYGECDFIWDSNFPWFH